VDTVSLDRQPTLLGELLELRPLRADDFQALFRMAADPLVWEQHPERDRYQEATFRAFFDDVFRSVRRVIFIIGPQSRRSQRAVEKIGSVPAGTRTDAQGRERLVYELTPVLYARSQGSGAA
jgi:RimJ/RimL family protein N-acetyltransferase